MKNQLLYKYPQFFGTKIIPQPNICFMYNKQNNIFDIFNYESLLYFQYINGENDGVSIVNNIAENFPETNISQITTDYIELLKYLDYKKYIILNNSSSNSNTSSIFEFIDNINCMKPIHADIEITQNCNLSCIYCYAESHKNYEFDNISLDKWKQKLEILKKQGLRAVKISGGEPFLYENIKEFCEYCATNFITSINSNGYFINTNIVEWLSSLNLQTVQISLDSMDEKIHDQQRGKGSWSKAYNAIILLRKYYIPTRISCTLSTNNNHQENINQLILFARQFGCELAFEEMTSNGRGKRLKASLFLENFCNTLHTDQANFKSNLNSLNIKCQAQLGFIGISHNGIVKPCNLTENFFQEFKIPILTKIDNSFNYHTSSTYQTTNDICKKADENYSNLAKIPKGGNKCILLNTLQYEDSLSKIKIIE